MALERWNTHFSTAVEVEVLGVKLRLAQDPSSENLGTTVWDASIVMAKYLEKNMRKGDFSRAKVRGKRAIDLGSGMGLGGLAFALIGADVVLTDLAPVLPLLRRNYENNLSPAALRAASGEGHAAEAAGRVAVAELDWAQPAHFTGCGEGGAGVVTPPFDYILAADCVYHETIIRHLYRALLALSSERSTILVANERRSESVQAAFTGLFSHSFTFKKVPIARMAEGYSHPAIELTILKRKKGASASNLDALEAAEVLARAPAEAALAADADRAAVAGAAAAPAAGETDSAGAGPATATGTHEEGGAQAVASGAAAASSSSGVGATHDKNSSGGQEDPGAAASSSGSCDRPDGSSDATAGGAGPGPSNQPLPASTPATAGLEAADAAATAMALAVQMAGALGVHSPLSFDERRAGSMAARLLSDIKVPPSQQQQQQQQQLMATSGSAGDPPRE